MNWGKYVLEAATLIIAAIVCAFVANAVASRERKLVVVPASSEQRAASRPVATPAPVATQTTQPTVSQATATQPPPSVVKPAVTKKPTTENRQPTTAFNPHPDKAYIEIGFDDVKSLHDKGVLFLDARRTSVYEHGHIPGARPFSVWESDIDEKVNKLFNERSDPKDQNLPIVVYCSGGDCEDSHMLAQKLWGIQFNNVYVYKDGFPDWQKRGGPIHTGTTP